MTFLGIAASTTARDEEWDFMDLGRYLERADKTTRFLDVASYLPSDEDEVADASSDHLHWSAILRSCSALGAFRAVQRQISAKAVVDFLLFSPQFPRSVHYCVERVDVSLHRISGTPRGTFSNKAERETGRLLADLAYGSVDEAFGTGLHGYLDALQERFNAIGEAIFESYVLMPDRIQTNAVREPRSSSALAAWQMQQQQQQ